VPAPLPPRHEGGGSPIPPSLRAFAGDRPTLTYSSDSLAQDINRVDGSYDPVTPCLPCSSPCLCTSTPLLIFLSLILSLGSCTLN